MEITVRRIISVLIVVLCLVISTQSARANRVKVQQTVPNVTFQILPELPKDNIGGQHLGYFNLKLKPNQTRKLRVKVLNPTDHEIKIDINTSNATMRDLQPSYLSASDNDILLRKPLSRRISVLRHIKLAAGQQKWIIIKIRNDNNFNGQQVAALNLISQNNSKGAIHNRFVYTVAIVANGQNVKKYQKLQIDNISMKTIDGHPNINLGFKNPDPIYLTNGTLKIELANQQWQFFKYWKVYHKVKIVPSIRFNSYFSFQKKKLVPGIYRLRFVFKNKKYQVTEYHYVKITRQNVSFISRRSAGYLVHRNQMIVMLLSLTLLISIIVIYLIKRERDKIEKSAQ